VSLPLLLVLALFRALRFEHGLTWLRKGGVGLFYWIDTAWFVGTVSLFFTLVVGRRAWGLGIVAGLFALVVMHSLIAHAADHFAGYDPAAAPEARPRRGWGKPLGCLTALAAIGAFYAYMWASMDILPGRAFSRAHDQIRPGLPLREVARVLTDLVATSGRGNFVVSLVGPDGKRQEVLSTSRARSERPSAAALEARMAGAEALHVWMGTFNLSGQFVILLNADGTVREASKVDGYIK
jgi:hypothetical protein